MAKEKSVGGVVFNKSEFLLLHYLGGHWDFPKGHVEEGETEKQTFFRELEEETAIKEKQIKLIPGFREMISYWFTQEGEQIFKEVFFFLAESQTKEVILSHEHQGFEWLSFEEAKKRLTFNNAKQVLEKAEVFLHQN